MHGNYHGSSSFHFRVEIIYKELQIDEINDTIAKRRKAKRNAQRIIERTEIFRKNRSIQNNIRKNWYSINKKEKYLHGYAK